MRQRHALQPAYVLSASPYGDTSLLLEIFTAEHGRCGLIARGARAPKSRLRALLQPLQALLLSWSDRGELGSLTAAEASAPPLMLGGERVFYAWYLNELLLRLLQRRDPHPELFAAYVQALSQLAGDSAEAALRHFELRLLAETGYGLHLPENPDEHTHYRLDADAEPYAVPPGPGSFSGRSLRNLAEGRLQDPQTLADARKILRAAIERQLGGRPLRTPRLLRELRARQEPASD